jgi:hypothetical protein
MNNDYVVVDKEGVPLYYGEFDDCVEFVGSSLNSSEVIIQAYNVEV